MKLANLTVVKYNDIKIKTVFLL